MKSFFLMAVLISFFSLELSAQSYCVTKPRTKLRTKPDGKSEISWRVPKYMPLMGTGKVKGSWLQVTDVDGQEHWAHRKDLTNRWNCLVVSRRSTDLRAGPSQDSELVYIGLAEKYSSFLDLGGEEGWTQVEDELGQKAWLELDATWKPTARIRLSFENQ